MANYTYRSFDLVTLAPLGEVPFTKVSFGEQVDAVGSFTGTVDLTDPNVQMFGWERATRPNMSLIVVDETIYSQVGNPASTVTISQITASGTTGTVTTETPHGFVSGQYVSITDTITPFAISSITENESSQTVITFGAGIGFAAGDSVLIAGTTNYNGQWDVFAVDGDAITVDAPYVADEADGTAIFSYPPNWNGVFVVTVTDTTDFTIDLTPLSSLSRSGLLASNGFVALATVAQSVCRGGWMVTGRNYDDGGYVVSGNTLGQWPTQRLQSIDYSKPPTGVGPYWGANPADPTTIAAQIIYDIQQTALTMPDLDAEYCVVGGNGTVEGTRSNLVILINGNAPPDIVGGSTTAIFANAHDVAKFEGINTGVVVGSALGDGGVYIPDGTTVTAVEQTSLGPHTASAQAWPVEGAASMLVYSVVRPAIGELIVCEGLTPGTTITSVTSLGGIQYTVGLSDPATSSHSDVTDVVISPYYSVTMSNVATVPDVPHIVAATVNYSTASGYSPTPSEYWISTTLPKSQFQTADEILTTLAQMGHDVGFDYSFDVTYIEGTTIPQVTLNIYYPRQGVSGDDVTLLVNRFQLTKELSYNEDGTQQENGIIETASKTGGVLSGYQANTDLVTVTGYPVVEGTQTKEKVNDKTMLAGVAQGDLQLLQNPTAVLTIEMPLAIDDPTVTRNPNAVSLGDFSLGDDMIFRIDPVTMDRFGNPIFGPGTSPRFPNGMNYEWRINEWLATVNDNGVSTLTLTLGIPPTTISEPPTPPPLA